MTLAEGLRYLPAMPPLNQNKTFVNASLAVMLSAVVFLAGCGKEEPEFVQIEEIHEKPVPVEQPHVHTPGDGHDHGTASPSGGLTYDVPQGWAGVTPSSMVLLAFQAGEPPQNMAEVAVSAFPGEVGGPIANVNRWRRQVGLGPVDEATALGLITRIEIAGLPAWQVSLVGPIDASKVGEPVKMVVSAVFKDGKTWFIKLVGGESAVDGELANYESFLQSIRF